MRVSLVAVTFSACLVGVQAQEPAERPSFEVASIRSATQGSNRTGPTPPDRFTARGVRLPILLRIAYDVPERQMQGVPEWARSATFDIEATIPDGMTQAQVPLMLQSLLEDRFSLDAHVESREGDIFALVFARDDERLGPNLTRSDIDCRPILEARAKVTAEARDRGEGPEAVTALVRDLTRPKPGEPQCAISASTRPSANGGALATTIRAEGMELAGLIDLLRGRTERPPVDRTGLSGTFNFELTFAETSPAFLAGFEAGRARAGGSPPGPPASDGTGSGGSLVPSAALDDSPTLFQALQEQIGLKLEPTTGPVDVLVIDHVEPPTEN